MAQNDSEKSWTRLHALWTLEGLDRSTYNRERLDRTAIQALNDKHPRVRASAIRILEPSLVQISSEMLAQVEELVETENSPFVKLQLLASLGEAADNSALDLMARIVDEHSDDPHFTEMAFTGVYQREAELAELLRNSYGWSEGNDRHEKLLAALDEAESQVSAESQDHLSEEQKHLFDLGRIHYRTCMACHGAQGEGLAGTGPALAGSEWVQGGPDGLIRIVLQGFTGGAAERGEEIASEMPGHQHLSDDVLAGILTYLRQSWGNNSTPIEPEEVQQVRRETSERSNTWTPEELRNVRE